MFTHATAYFMLDDGRHPSPRIEPTPFAWVRVGEDDDMGVHANFRWSFIGASGVRANSIVGADPGPITAHSSEGSFKMQRATLTTRDIPEVQIALANFSAETLEVINACKTDDELQKIIFQMLNT